MDMAQRIREDARLIILKELGKQVDERLHSGHLSTAILAYGGIDRPREWVHGELDWLAEIGAVTLTKPGSVVIATLVLCISMAPGVEGSHCPPRHLWRAVAAVGSCPPWSCRTVSE